LSSSSEVQRLAAASKSSTHRVEQSGFEPVHRLEPIGYGFERGDVLGISGQPYEHEEQQVLRFRRVF
jgi:hypothetical protein